MSTETTTRRQDLVRIAAQEFARRGYRATTLRHIADAAGILPGSLYHHFGSKEELLREVMTLSTAEHVETLERIAADGRPAPEQLRAALRARLELYREQGLALGVVLQTDTTTLRADVFAPMRDLGYRIERAWTRILGNGVKDGFFEPDLDLRTTTFAVVGMLNWAHRWFDPDGRLGPAELADRWADLLLGGLLKDGRA